MPVRSMRFTLGAALATTLGLPLALHHHKAPLRLTSVAAADVPRWDNARALNRTESLFYALLPQYTQMRLAAEETSAYADKVHPSHFWGVSALNAQNQELATFRWHSETGDLLCFNHLGYLAHRPALPEPAAVKASWRWLRTLGLLSKGNLWRLSEPPQCSSNRTWAVSLRTPTWLAHFRIDCEGNLLTYKGLPIAPGKEPAPAAIVQRSSRPRV